MISITRISGNPLGVSQYQLMMNDTVISASFDHNRTDDLPMLLRKAADQVVIERSNHATAVYQTKSPDKIDAIPTVADVMDDIRDTISHLEAQCEQTDSVDEKIAWSLAIQVINAVLTTYGT